jgi:hypothetical protein
VGGGILGLGHFRLRGLLFLVCLFVRVHDQRFKFVRFDEAHNSKMKLEQLFLCFLLLVGAAAAAGKRIGKDEVERSKALATECTIARNGDSRCKLSFDVLPSSKTKSVQLVVRDNGRLITCTPGRRNDYGDNTW